MSDEILFEKETPVHAMQVIFGSAIHIYKHHLYKHRLNIIEKKNQPFDLDSVQIILTEMINFGSQEHNSKRRVLTKHFRIEREKFNRKKKFGEFGFDV